MRDRSARYLVYAVATAPHWYIAWTLYPGVFGKLPLLLPLLLLLAAFALVASRGALRVHGLLPTALLVFLGATLLAGIFGVDPAMSFWGDESRGGGFVVLVHFALFAFALPSVLRAPAHWTVFLRWLFWPAVAAGAVVLAEAAAPNIARLYGEAGRFSAWFGNPTFFGGFAVMVTFIGVILANRVRGQERLLVLAGAVLLSISVLFSGSRGPVLALAASAIVAAVSMLLFLPRGERRRQMTRIGIGIAGATVVAALLLAAEGSVPLSRIGHLGDWLSQGTPRLLSWGVAWDAFAARPVLGWGPENFRTAFDRHYDPRLLRYSFYETVSDKPHSLPFEILATGGVVLVVSWLAILVGFIVTVLRLRRRGVLAPVEAAGVLAALTAYLVHTAFLFDTLPTTVLLFALFGFLMRDASSFVPTQWSISLPRPVAWAALAMLLAADVFLLGTSVPVSHAVERSVTNRPDEWVRSVALVDRTLSPHRVDFFILLLQDLGEHDSGGDWTREQLLTAARSVREAVGRRVAAAPDNFLLWFMYGRLLSIEGEYAQDAKTLQAAVDAMETALRISPGRQAAVVQLSKALVLQGKPQQAVARLEALVVADPALRDIWWYLGLAASLAGDKEKAADAFMHARGLGLNYHTPTEAELVIEILAAVERYADIVPIYEELIEQNPDNAQWHANLAATYAALGKLPQAAIEAQRAAELDPSFRDEADAFLREIETSSP